MENTFFQKFNQKQILLILISLTFFTLPLSISLRSIFLGLTTAALLLYPPVYTRLKDLIKEPWCIALLALFLFIILSSFYSEALWGAKLSFIGKYAKLLYIPLFAIIFQDKRFVQFSLHAFLFAMLITVICSLMKHLDPSWFPLREVDGIFHNHLATSYFMSFAAFLSAIFCVESKGKARLFYLLLLGLFAAHLFLINTAKTGYISAVVLFLVFTITKIPLKKIPLYLLLCLPLMGVVIYKSTALNASIERLVIESRQHQAGWVNTSMGYRMEFHKYAKKLYKEHPLLGIGTGGFSAQFEKDNPVPHWGNILLDPHDQYWLILVENGRLGFVLLFLFFLTLFYDLKYMRNLYTLFAGLMLSFITINLFDSFLLLSAAGYFFVLFSGLCLSESIHRKESSEIELNPILEANPC